MNLPLPCFNALDVLRDMEQGKSGGTNQTLATLETLAATPSVPSLLRDRILRFTDDDWFEIEERSAIIEHDGGMSRFEAEAGAIVEKLAKG